MPIWSHHKTTQSYLVPTQCCFMPTLRTHVPIWIPPESCVPTQGLVIPQVPYPPLRTPCAHLEKPQAYLELYCALPVLFHALPGPSVLIQTCFTTAQYPACPCRAPCVHMRSHKPIQSHFVPTQICHQVP